MNKKRQIHSRFSSAMRLKCPDCGITPLFVHANPYFHLGAMLDMPKQCSECSCDFTVEPGFYLGALWLSYPIVILLIILITALGVYLVKMEIIYAIIMATAVLLLLTPMLIRYARAFFLSYFAGG